MKLSAAQPATLLLAWGILLLVLLHESGMRVMVGAVFVVILSVYVDRQRVLALLRRSRWLLLATLVAFGWMTPGMPVPGLPGATGDGLMLALEQTSRLVISIAMTAMLLAWFEFSRLLSALRGVALPLRWIGLDVDRGVLRLALVIGELDRPVRTASAFSLLDESTVSDRTDDPVRIATGRIGIEDACVLLAVLGVVFLVPRP